MSQRNRTGAVVVVALIWLVGDSLVATAGPVPLKSSVKGDVKPVAVDVIEFGPEGLLLIGDGRGSQVLAVATGDTRRGTPLSGKIEGIDEKLAGRLGTTRAGIEILDLAVNPASGRAVFALRKQDDKSYPILVVDGRGTVDELILTGVDHARVRLDAGGKAVLSKITDLAWAEDRVLASARADAEFTSKLFVLPTPLAHDATASVFSAETFHVSHGRWETKAPMSAIIPYREGNQTYVVGAFACTPIVKYSLDSVQPGANVKGTSVLELGSGNRPLDMFTYEKGDKFFVLANTFRFHHERAPLGPSPYWTVRFDRSILAEKEQVNEKAMRRLAGKEPASDRVQMIEAFHGVMLMDKLDEERAVVLRSGPKGSVDLEVLPLP